MASPKSAPRARDEHGRFLPAAAPATPAPDQPQAETSPLQAQAGFDYGYSGLIGYGTQGYAGVGSSRHRQFPWFPQLDTRKEITPYTRVEALRRNRYCKANIGFYRRLLKGAALMVAGTGLEVHPTTTDLEWNKLARDRFNARTGQAAIFDLGGRFNFSASQLRLLEWSYGDGDCGVALTESAAGLARVAFYEGHQIGSGKLAPGEEEYWRDGVRVDPATNAPQLYRLLGGDTVNAFYATEQTDVPVQDFIYFGEYESNGQTRCITRLHSALNHVFDRAEIHAALKVALKQTAQKGEVIETDIGGANPKAPGMEMLLGPRQTAATFTNPDTGAVTNITHEQLYGAGQILRLNPGQKVKVIADTRPSNEMSTFLEEVLVRECAWGFGLPPEVIWNIASLGGANTRFILASAQQFIEQQQQFLIDTYCARLWIYTIAKELKYGGLRACQDPMWWKHQWITPPRITVDFGKDGALYLKQLGAGALTYKRLYGWQSLDSEEELNQHLDEVRFIVDGLKTRKVAIADYLALRADAAASSRVAAAVPEDPAAPAPQQSTGY